MKTNRYQTWKDVLFRGINGFVFALFSLLCVFPFYYIFINSISDNTMVANGVQVYSPTAEELETFKVAQEPVMEYLKKNLSDPTLVDSLFSAIETAETMEDEGLTASGGGTQIAAAASQRGTLNLAAIAGIMVVLMAVVFLCTRRRGNEMEE